MLTDYKSLAKERLSIDWEGWLLIASFDEDGNCKGFHDLDWIHNGKKLMDPLDSPVKILQLGEDRAFYTHLEMIYNKYSFDEHGLKLEDVKRKNRQNWASSLSKKNSRVFSCNEEFARGTPREHTWH